MTTAREVLYGNEQSGDRKPVTAFHPLKELPKGTEISGRHIGRFESKKKPGYFFHMFENEAGEVHAYGTCSVLDERVRQFEEKLTEFGANKNQVMMSTTFLGRLKNKNNDRTSYKFTQLVVFKPGSSSKTDATEINNETVPF